MPASRRPRVVIVEDDAHLRQLFSEGLGDQYEVREAVTGAAALGLLDDDADVMLLDRDLGDFSGVDVLRLVRDRGHDVPIVMVTTLHPTLDILELGVDEYLVKPVGIAELREVVETLLLLKEYDEVIREYFALASKLSTLRSSIRSEAFESDERFARAEERLAEVKRRASLAFDTAFEAGKFDELVQDSASTDRVFEDIDDE